MTSWCEQARQLLKAKNNGEHSGLSTQVRLCRDTTRTPHTKVYNILPAQEVAAEKERQLQHAHLHRCAWPQHAVDTRRQA